jgi:nucleotide-binding universal stress UspA family protein
MSRTILLPVDPMSPEAEAAAVRAAIEQARAFGAKLLVLAVIPDYGTSFLRQFVGDDVAAKALATAKARLEAFAREELPDDITVETLVASGVVYTEVLRVAQERHAAMIIVTAQRPTLPDYLLGSNATKIVQHATCSVLVVRE